MIPVRSLFQHPQANLDDDRLRQALAHRCAMCGAPADCIGAYENATTPAPACSDCCAHGCEDGKCEPIACCYCQATSDEKILLRVGPGGAAACHPCATLNQTRTEIAWLAICQATLPAAVFDRLLEDFAASGQRLSS